MRWLLALLTIAALAAALLLGGARWWSPAAAPTPRVGRPAPSAVPTSDADRDAMTARQAAPTQPFVSEIDGEQVEAPVRDGIVVLLLDAARQPVVGRDIEVSWSTGRIPNGSDRGMTDGRGRFATTVTEVTRIDRIAVEVSAIGQLGTTSSLLPSAADPRVVVCVLPDLQPVRIRVVDQRGRPVAGATVDISGDDASATPREHELRAEYGLLTDGDGRVQCALPASRHWLVPRAGGHQALHERIVVVPRGGCEVTLQLFQERDRHELQIVVRGPDEALREQRVWAYTDATESGVMPAEGAVPIGMVFAAEPIDAGDGVARFVVRTPPMALRCEARDSRGRWTGDAAVSPSATEVTIELSPEPVAAPRAILHCTVLLPDAQPTNDARLHVLRTLDPGEANWQGNRCDTPIEVDAGGTACVSARLDGFAPAVTGPIELTPGDHQVVLHLQRAARIAGHVVQADGGPARTWVKLLRPLGPLRALDPAASELARQVPHADMIGTDTDGSFAFDDVGPGLHVLWAEGRRTPLPARLEVRGGQHDVRLVLGDGIGGFARVGGRVTAAATGTPIANATVRMHDANRVAEALTDDDGRYDLVIEPGSATLTVRSVGQAWHQSAVTIATAGEHRHDIALHPSEPLFVRVRTPDGDYPVLEVHVFDAAGRALALLDHEGAFEGHSVLLGSNGRAELGGLPIAPLRLQLHAAQDELQQMSIDVPADTPRDRDYEIVWRPDRR